MSAKATIASIVLNNFVNDSRVQKEAESLSQHSYQVTVLALHEEPLAEHEHLDGFRVHRIRLKSRHLPRVFAVQIIKYFEFLLRTIKLYRHSNVIHCHDLGTLPIGVLIKGSRFGNTKLVYDAHEYETEVADRTGMLKTITKVMERALIPFADAVITVSDSIADEYVRLYSIPKPALVLNTPPLVTLDRHNLFRQQFNIASDTRIFLYQGSLSEGRGIETLLEAFKHAEVGDSAIIFMGYGPLQLAVEEQAQTCSRIYFKSAVAPKDILPYTASADAGFAFIEDKCLSYRYCLPNKLFEYAMAGVPVVCSDLPEMKKIVGERGIGVVADNWSVDGVHKAIRLLASMDKSVLKQNIESVKSEFNWEKQAQVLLDIYESL